METSLSICQLKLETYQEILYSKETLKILYKMNSELTYLFMVTLEMVLWLEFLMLNSDILVKLV